MFQYNIKTVVKIVDGDTVDLLVDLGFGILKKDRFRLSGINTPEMRGPEKVAGRAAKRFVEDWFAAAAADGFTLQVDTFKDKAGKYGRFIAQIAAVNWTEDGKVFTPEENVRVLNADLVSSGHAVEVTY